MAQATGAGGGSRRRVESPHKAEPRKDWDLYNDRIPGNNNDRPSISGGPPGHPGDPDSRLGRKREDQRNKNKRNKDDWRAQRASLLKRHGAKALINLLRARGYRVPGGKWRGIHNAALTAYVRKQDPALFNSKWKREPTPRRPLPTESAAQQEQAQGGGSKSGGPGKNHPQRRGGGRKGNASSDNRQPANPYNDQMAALLGDLESMSDDFIDPTAYAEALTEKQYGPLIREIGRQQRLQQAQETQNLAEIGGWYKQLGRANQQRLLSDREAAEAAIGGLGDMSAGLIEALGGSDAAGQVGGMAANWEGMMRGFAQAQESFDRDMQTVIGLQGNDARVREQRTQDQLAGDLARQMIEARNNRAQDLTVNAFNAQDAALRQRAGYQNMLLGAMMAPQELELAKAQIASTRANTRHQIALTNAERQRLAAIQAGILGPDGEPVADPWSEINPIQQDELRQLILQNLVRGPNTKRPGTLTVHPQRAYNLMGDRLRRAGFNPASDPRVRGWRDSLLNELMSNQWWRRAYPGQAKWQIPSR